MSDQLALLPDYLGAHLRLSLLALALGAAVSLPLGIFATRRPRLEETILGIASVIQTIPSLALLAIMVPALAAIGALTESAFGMEIRSIGFLPAIVALTLYSLLPILRNTVTGIRGIDPALIEAARGVGMTPRQQLLRVEIPLALPVIVAGIRTAAVWVVGMATLSTPVGAPSLGNYIFTGLQTNDLGAVSIGCMASAALALLLDGTIRRLERGLSERKRAVAGSAGGVLLALAVGTLVAWLAGIVARGGEAPFRIGAKSYTEQYVLAQILAGTVESVGTKTEVLQSLGSSVVFDALRTGQVGAYVDYSGTVWATHMKRSDVRPRAEVLDAVREYLAAEHDIRLAAVLGFENAYALGVRAADVKAKGFEKISDLTLHASTLEIGGDYQFFSRPEWDALQATYGLAFRKERTMDPALMYEAVASGQVDVISAYTTDGRIKAFDLAVLEDDRRAIPPYDAIVLVNGAIAREHPEVLAALAQLEGTIDADRMRAMNYEVDEKGATPTSIAREFLNNR